uniref:Mitochondrial import inner membrane translocase subunit TIM50 n=1 Tax=Xenopus tropicalis TaxID=8364 RepID=A0A803JXW7_XENTR
MMRTPGLLGLRGFVAFAAKLWSFVLYLLRRQVRTIIQYQTVRYDVLPLSPASRNRLSQVKRKVLVLDLDETLIHSHHDGVLRPTVRPGTPPDFILKVVIDKHPVRFFVHKRPHVDFFLEVVSQWYELVVFTASMEIYGSAVADKLDNNRGVLRRRFYRQVHSRRPVRSKPQSPPAPTVVTVTPAHPSPEYPLPPPRCIYRQRLYPSARKEDTERPLSTSRTLYGEGDMDSKMPLLPLFFRGWGCVGGRRGWFLIVDFLV